MIVATPDFLAKVSTRCRVMPRMNPSGTRVSRASASGDQAIGPSVRSESESPALSAVSSSAAGTGHMALRASTTPSSAKAKEISLIPRSKAISSIPALTVARTISGTLAVRASAAADQTGRSLSAKSRNGVTCLGITVSLWPRRARLMARSRILSTIAESVTLANSFSAASLHTSSRSLPASLPEKPGIAFPMTSSTMSDVTKV